MSKERNSQILMNLLVISVKGTLVATRRHLNWSACSFLTWEQGADLQTGHASSNIGRMNCLWLCARNASTFMRRDHMTGHSLGKRNMSQRGQVITCVLLVGSRHGHVKGPFLNCSAALVARAGVRCTSCIRIRERTVSDYGVESSHPPPPPPPQRRLRW